MAGQRRHIIRRAVLAAGMAIFGFVFNLSLAETPFTPSDRSFTAYSIDLSPAVPDTAEDPIIAARKALEAQQYASAVALFESALETDASALNGFSEDYSAALQAMAQGLLATDPAAAKSALLKALEIEPDSVPALSKLGDIFVRENDYPHAIDYYRKAAELQPRLPKTFFNLGYIYWETENYAQAKEMFARVVQLEPDYLDEALFNLAMAQEQLGERSQCLQNLKRAIEINPGNVSAAAYLKQLSEDKE